MLRTRIGLFVGVLLMVCAPAALACNCSSGGDCHCGDGCACGSTEATTAGMTTPSERIVAVAAAAPQTVHVAVNDFSFGADVTLNVGDTLQWDWNSTLPHTISTVSGSQETFDSGTLFTGPYSHTFTTPGTITYYCKIHGIDNFDGTALGMAATVTVQAVPEPAAVGTLSLALLGCVARRRRALTMG
jgi:plastocyanin